ncbi:MAG: FkbM family methyltransferase, partial [Nitrospiraceae bacterium]|nr:FkbM family methyltransferase [Nitrospiraceae bacterium]
MLFFSPKSKCILLYTSIRHFLKYFLKFGFAPRELKISVFGYVFAFKEFTGEIGMFPQIFIDHIYDSDPSAFSSLDKADAVLFDIGANIGMFSIKMAKQYPRARIYSFEPNPDVFERLARNIETNNVRNVFACNMGMSDVDETAFIDGRGSTVLGKITKTREAALSEVRLTTIDSFMEKNGIGRVDLLKIDVEGYEYRVVRGIEANAGHISRIIMECDRA